MRKPKDLGHSNENRKSPKEEKNKNTTRFIYAATRAQPTPGHQLGHRKELPIRQLHSYVYYFLVCNYQTPAHSRLYNQNQVNETHRKQQTT